VSAEVIMTFTIITSLPTPETPRRILCTAGTQMFLHRNDVETSRISVYLRDSFRSLAVGHFDDAAVPP